MAVQFRGGEQRNTVSAFFMEELSFLAESIVCCRHIFGMVCRCGFL